MTTVFANNQLIVAAAPTSSVITTDPVPLNGNDRIWPVLNVHYIFGGTTRAIEFQAQGSNNGVDWVNVGPMGSANAVGVSEANAIASSIYAAFIRYQYTLVSTGSGTVVACFDHNVSIDKA